MKNISQRLPVGFSSLTKAGGKTWLYREKSIPHPDTMPWEQWINGSNAAAYGEGRATVYKVQYRRGHAGILRRYRHGGLLGSLLGSRFWHEKRFVQELRVSEYLRERGVRTPEVLALHWKRGKGGGVHGWILTREIPEALNLAQWIRSGGWAIRQERRRLLELVADALAGFHRAGGVHRDLNLGNLLLEQNRRIFILDLDRATIRAPLTLGQRASNLLRLYRSLARVSGNADPLSLRERWIFLWAYSGKDSTLLQSMREELGRRWKVAEYRRKFPLRVRL